MSKHQSDLPVNLFTVVDLLRWRALHQPDRLSYTFLVNGETVKRNLTYGELDRQARAIGALLHSSGASGERALLLYPLGLEFIAAFFGCLYGRVMLVPAYLSSPAQLDRTLPRLWAIANDAQPRVALTTLPILSMVKILSAQAQDCHAMRWMATDTVDSNLGDEWRDPALSSDALAFLQYTSGSMAVPKGVMVSHGNVLHSSILIHRCFDLTLDSRAVSWLPPYHDMGLIGGCCSASTAACGSQPQQVCGVEPALPVVDDGRLDIQELGHAPGPKADFKQFNYAPAGLLLG